MEAAKKEVAIAEKLLMAEFTELDQFIGAALPDPEDIIDQANNLDIQMESFLASHEKYCQLLLTARDDEEYENQATNKVKLIKKRTGYNRSIRRLTAPPATAAAAPSQNPTTTKTTGYRIQLPQRSIPSFSGDIKRFKSFWASFSEIDKDAEIPDVEKFNYLFQFTEPGSKARKVMEGFARADINSYQLAKKEMEERFGNEKSIIKEYVRDLLNLVIENAKDKKHSNFIDSVTAIQAQIWNLEQLKVTPDKYGLLLYPIVESCLPPDVLQRYLESNGAKEDLPDLMKFLRQEVRRREEAMRAQDAFAGKDKEERKPKMKQQWNTDGTDGIPTALTLSKLSEKNTCGFCGMTNHSTGDCRKAHNMSMEAKKAALQQSKSCFRCLRKGHDSRRCQNKNLCCAICQKGHHTLMCFGRTEVRQQTNNTNLVPVQLFDPNRLEVAPVQVPRMDLTNTIITKPDVLLQTLLANLHYGNSFKEVRICMDSMSQSSYILTRTLRGCTVLEELGVERVVHQTFGGDLSAEMQHKVVKITLSGVSESFSSQYNIIVSVVETIADNVIGTPHGPWMDECYRNGIEIRDTELPADVEVLIGNDYAPYFKAGMQTVLLESGLVATETKLGWFIEGRVPGTMRKDPSKALVCINMGVTSTKVQDYWALDVLGIQEPCAAKSRQEMENAALEHFRQTVTRDETGRYEVHLPWIEGHPSLPENRAMAYRVLEKTTKDLIQKQCLANYDNVFQEWLQSGIIEKVPVSCTTSGITHYMGHRPVFKPSSTTPVRPVFNGSGRSKGNASLNDCLEKGPQWFELIPSMLLRFQLHQVGIISDVKKAFLQIKVTEQHRNSLRFLWWEDLNSRKKVAEYRHCRVVFGVSSSPFLLAAVVKKMLEENMNKYPETVGILADSFYVDNLVTSVPTMGKANQLEKEARDIFFDAQMDSRGWEHGPDPNGKNVSVLGVVWNTKEDKLSLELNSLLNKPEKITKRIVLSLANSFYDPLGWLSPVIITLKIIFKNICTMGKQYDWDDLLPEDIQAEVENWRKFVPEIKFFAIPRFVGSSDKEKWSLHVFCDASKDAYACCIFLRMAEDPVKLHLLRAKNRVTPAERVTIPRAELLGCLIAARLYKETVKDLRMEEVPVTFWSDSSTALTWIKKDDEVWSGWLNRRVEEIRLLTNVDSWKHVPGTLNPADHPSRGITFKKYMEISWWEGPAWLYGNENLFPSCSPTVNLHEVNREKKKTVVSYLNIRQQLDKLNLMRLGDWQKILRVVAYCLRFKKNGRRDSGQINVDELEAAEKSMILHIQNSEKEIMKKISSDMKSFVDHDGTIRIVTKLVHGEDFQTEFRYPALLPGDNQFVQLLIMKEHSLNSHCGIQYLMEILREKYWISSCRRHVRSILHRCPICRVYFAKACKVVQSPLPTLRITTTHCFETIGVDLAGPLFVKTGEKAWIVLFTCAVYRAVHMEIVKTISTEDFLFSLRKFIARRGRPRVIYSDNGTNFVGCSGLLHINWEKVKEYTSAQKIMWIFNAPTAAWWGGFWERIIGMMKQILRRNLGSRVVQMDELEVLVLEAESVLNERPLTVLSEDPMDLRPLTPSHFIRDLRVAVLPEGEVTGGLLRKNLKHINRLKEVLKTRFQKEYLAMLVCDGRVKKSTQLQPGSVVLIEMDNKKRSFWPLGIVMEVFKGKDGVCRSARVKTKDGEYLRPFQRLYLLEMANSSEEINMEAIEAQEQSTVVNVEQEEIEEITDDICIEEVMELAAEAEPIMTSTRYGRVIKKPIRLVENLSNKR